MFPTPFAEETQTQKSTETFRSKKIGVFIYFPSAACSHAWVWGRKHSGGGGGINFLNFIFCFILLPKASCEEMRVAKGKLLINAGICLKIQEAKFDVHLPNQASGVGWQVQFQKIPYQIFFPICLVTSLSLPAIKTPWWVFFSRAL